MEILAFGIGCFSLLLALLGCLDAAASRLRIALPLLAAIAGLTGGIAILVVDPVGRDWLLDPYDLWFLGSLSLTPQSVVTLLLPPLLFELTLGVDVRKLRQDTVIVGVMAVIAVVVATGLVGLSLTLFAGVPLVASLLLGATISTTDPAAVVAIFRRIGAPRRLLIVLEGESLLNDAAAIALFVLFIGMLREQAHPTVGGVIGDFASLFALGALTGIAVGWVASKALSLLHGNFPAQTSLSLAATYACYLIAEFAVGASGVVAVVSAGLTVTMSGASRVSSEDWGAVRTVWSQLGYWSNGMIILIAAALSPALLVQLRPADLALVALVVFGAFAARALILFVLLPVMDRLGASSPITGTQKLLIWWGGIRGAVTLLLALSLASSSALPPELGTKLAAVGVAFVFFTLLINGSSLAWVTRRLGLDRLSPSDQALRSELVERTIHRGIEHLTELAREHDLTDSSIESVKQALLHRLEEFSASSHPTTVPAFRDRLRTGLIIVANQERRIVRQHYDEGVVGRDTMRHLQRIAESLADAAMAEGRDGYAELADRHVDYPSQFRLAVWLQ
ncbi:MAG: cation:proton antiporter, partial [Geminicoccaceae bacterium]